MRQVYTIQETDTLLEGSAGTDSVKCRKQRHCDEIAREVGRNDTLLEGTSNSAGR